MEHVDVVIPVYRPNEKLYRCLVELCMQTVLPERIFLINTEVGVAKENQMLAKYVERALGFLPGKGRVKIVIQGIRQEWFDHGATRNFAFSLCRSPYVLCMTQDAVPKDHFLIERLLASFREYPRAAAVYARQEADDKTSLEAVVQEFNYPKTSTVKSADDYERLGIKTIFCSNACCLYDRRRHRRLGGFPSDVIFNEDMMFARKMIDAGYQIVYNAEACVVHCHHYTLTQYLRRNFDLAVSQVQHPEVFAELSSESEGIRMVLQGVKVLWKQKRYFAIVYFVLQSGAKWLGYRIGRKYRSLSPKTVRKFSMNQRYWEYR